LIEALLYFETFGHILKHLDVLGIIVIVVKLQIGTIWAFLKNKLVNRLFHEFNAANILANSKLGFISFQTARHCAKIFHSGRNSIYDKIHTFIASS